MPTQYLAFAAIAAGAAYVQTLTGFALGLLLMGGVGLTGIVPLPDAAIVVSTLVLANAAQVLALGWRQVARRELGLILLAGLPAVAIGYEALGVLAAWNDGLRIALGAAILISASQLLAPGATRATPSSALATLGFGAAGGLMSGLFSAAGPPLVYHLYRQPLPFVAIRETLVTVFALNAATRIALVTTSGAMTPPLIGLAACALPAVVAATTIARRWPPPLSPTAIRRLVFALLALSGLSLGLPPLLRMVGRA